MDAHNNGDNDIANQNHSLASIEHDLNHIFTQHPNSQVNDAGEPIIPADALVDVFQSFSDIYNGFQLLSTEEMDMLKQLLASNPGLQVTPQILLDFIAAKTKNAPQQDNTSHRSHNGNGGSPQQWIDDSIVDNQEVARMLDQDSAFMSDESNGSFSLLNASGGPYSRPPSRGPATPGSGSKSSVFDNERRQRSQPLATAAPSSWNNKRPAPAGRRKSDAGSRSDSESFITSPSTVFRRSTNDRRSRAPSNPTSPSAQYSSLHSPMGSPSAPPSSFQSFSLTGTGRYSRPPSRSGSHSHSLSQPFMSQYGSPPSSSALADDYASSDDNYSGSLSRSTNSLYDYQGRRRGNSFMRTTSSRSSVSPHPGPSAELDSSGVPFDLPNNSFLGDSINPELSDLSGSSSDEEDSALGLVLDRTANASTVSLEPLERVDALQRANAELGRKLIEAESTLQRKLTEHEAELEEMQSKLDEMRTELVATKREEKELRSKERQNMTQIMALEAEISKVTRALEHARATYGNLQKQYQEQCAASEKYRDDLRVREEVIRNLREAASMHEVEAGKWAREHESYEDRIIQLENELSVAQQAHAQLDEQKQENLLLKETIDRMRFEMDEMRSGLNLGIGPGAQGGLPGSGMGTISKSLGDELAGKMKWESEEKERSFDKDREESGAEEGDEEEGESFSSETAVSVDGEESAEEDVIQTVITRRKRKVASRATNKVEPVTTQVFEETKEYSDTGTQYDPEYFFVSGGIQTEAIVVPRKEEVHVQTDVVEEPPSPVSPAKVEFSVQAEPEEVGADVLRVEMEVQTEDVETAVSDEQMESLASSSSTILPPTPRPTSPAPSTSTNAPADEPPAYTTLAGSQVEERAAEEWLKKLHPGVTLPLDGLPGGVSDAAVAEWQELKAKLGIECAVIDEIVGSETSASASTASRSGGSSRIGGRFYNIYNTYLYGVGSGVHHHHSGNGKVPPPPSFLSTIASMATQAVMWAGASAFVLFFMAPYMGAGTPYGATHYDRYAWNSFNSLHGGMMAAAAGVGMAGAAAAGAEGTAAVWNILGRVGNGAARVVRGWPT
ncbi:hypothetical protein AMATHDRAFT_200766 [Amanita thiersii Skay4041]|uniref:Uncharacterized protein n=1 Tax=Amanita thiersii Skay4041 TaxID=703135 RepID=A0A2A9N6F8_9AGAR|nr:hypothetical protein AMATHDRAFT_200766 [Amanita thiersii Skay4041]